MVGGVGGTSRSARGPGLSERVPGGSTRHGKGVPALRAGASLRRRRLPRGAARVRRHRQASGDGGAGAPRGVGRAPRGGGQEPPTAAARIRRAARGDPHRAR